MPADHRPARYIERDADGAETVVYRASDLGGCERAIVATAQGFQGAPRPAWFQAILDEGALCEADIAHMWDLETDIPTINDQLEVELEVGEIDGRRVIVRGHIDGEAGLNNRVGREYKKFRESTWPNFQRQGVECQPNYPWQVSVYMHARGYTELEFVGGHVTGYRDDDGVLHDKPYDGETAPPQSEWRLPVIGEVECKLITMPPIPLKDIIKRVVRLERLVTSGLIALEVPCNGKKYPCPFYIIHDEDETTEYTLPKSTRNRQLVQAFATVDTKLVKLRAEERKLDAAKKALVAELREVVSAEGPEAVDAARIIYGTTVIVRTRYHKDEATRTTKAYDVDSMAVKKEKD